MIVKIETQQDQRDQKAHHGKKIARAIVFFGDRKLIISGYFVYLVVVIMLFFADLHVGHSYRTSFFSHARTSKLEFSAIRTSYNVSNPSAYEGGTSFFAVT